MNSFGLGLVLNFVDNASAGMGRATSAFQQMSSTADMMSSSMTTSMSDIVAASYALDNVGSTLMNTGASIIGAYTNVSQSIINTGLEMMGYRNQLKALYGDDSFEQKMQEIQAYAADSVFEVQGLTQAVVTMKAVGIEAMDEITTSSGNNTQKLLDYASDIAAMFPNMRNAYGTGVNAVMGALKEYIAEGNAMSLKRGAGLDITQLLGEEKGATVEERMRQVADLTELLGIVGYTQSLMGTPTQQLSRMQDILFNTMSKISDSGVLERYTNLLTKLADWMETLYSDTETFDTIVSVLSDTLSAILAPLESILDLIIENTNAIIGWVKENPELTKNILLTVAAIGALLVVGGSILKLISTLGFAMSGLNALRSLPVMMSQVFGMLGSSLGSVFLTALPLIGLASMLYYAWKNNIMGIKDIVTDTFKKIWGTISLVVESWGMYTLSGESFLKAKELGVLPLIESILDLKFRFENFRKGFVDGWKSITESVINTVSAIAESIGNTLGPVFQPVIDKITEFFDKLTGSDVQSWYDFGASFAKFSGIATVVVTIVGVVGRLVRALGGIASIIRPIIAIVSAHPIVAAVVAVVAVLGILYNTCDEFKGIVDSLFSSISEIFGGVFSQLLDALKGSIVLLTASLIPLKDSFMSFLPQVGGFFLSIIQFVGQLIGKVIELAMSILPSLIKVWTTLLTSVMQVLPILLNVWETLFSVITDLIFPVVMQLIDLIVPFITQIANSLSELISGVLSIVVGLLEDIIPVVTNLIQLILPMIKNIADALMPVIATILNIATAIVGRLIPNIKNVLGMAADVIRMAIDIATPIITAILQIVEVIISVLLPIIDVILQAIGFVIDIILGIVQVTNSVIAFVVKIITSIVGIIMSIVNAVVQAVMTGVAFVVGIVQTVVVTITSIISGIISAVQFVWDAIVTTFSNAVSFFGSVFGEAAEAVKGVFQGIADFFTELWDGIITAFSTIGDAISGAVRGGINTILGGAVGIVNGFISALNLAIDIINAIPGVSISRIDLLAVPQLAEGGVVDRATTAVIGEAGAEAVVPLENNTGWIDKVAEKVAPSLVTEQNHLQPNSPSTVKEEHNDYSVTFAPGSVIIQLANATEAELERAADKLMKIIERKQQLKQMAVRA